MADEVDRVAVMVQANSTATEQVAGSAREMSAQVKRITEEAEQLASANLGSPLDRWGVP